MLIERNSYVDKLWHSRHNGMIKVVTGMRRCGKSFLLFNLFAQRLRSEGIDGKHIVQINLEDRRNKSLRDPDRLLKHIDSQLLDDKMHYIMLDEVQLVTEFEDVLNSYLHVGNVDVYATGSNAKFLSKDIITEFRGRSYEIRVHPLSFAEFLSAQKDATSNESLLNEFMQYGGLPKLIELPSEAERRLYLQGLFAQTYLRDIKERHSIQLDADLDELVDVMASSIGCLTNPLKLHRTFQSVKHSNITVNTIKKYLDHLQDAFLIEKAVRYDIKGKHYISTPAKYYFEDLGLRNARLNFRQIEAPHLLENLIYNELRMRGYSVDVGQITLNGRNDNGVSERRQLEVDFVCNKGYERIYIQSAFAMQTDEKREQEFRSLKLISDGFQKVVIAGGTQPTYRNNDGILILNIFDFLLNKNSILL